jgi:hypothetical protein
MAQSKWSPWAPPIEAKRFWQSHTMTTTNYLYVLGSCVHYGVDSMDDEQAFHSICAIEDFFDSEGNWWMQLNLSEESLYVREYVERTIYLGH